MTGNNNTYYKSSMYEDRGENTAQEIIIALAIAVISLLLAGVIISHFSGSLSSGSYYGSGNSSGNGGYSNNDGSSGGGYVGDGTEDTEDYDDTDYDDADDTAKIHMTMTANLQMTVNLMKRMSYIPITGA